jgi:hypothetical protein
MAFLPERFAAMRSDIPGTAGHQYIHIQSPFCSGNVGIFFYNGHSAK